MSDQTDPLSNEVSISAKLESNGVKGAAKSRAIAAFDRLVGNIMDAPSAYIENWNKRVRAKGSGVESLITGEYEAASDILNEDANFGQSVAEKFLYKEARKQSNKEAIAAKTIEQLETRDDERDSSEDPIDDDWLNFFEDYAEKATSERMRDLWANVLSGEIRKPGNFSLTTLRVLSELDAKIAEVFEEAMKFALPNGMIPKPYELEGQELLNLMFLEEVGLLQDVNGRIGVDFKMHAGEITRIRFGDVLLELEGGPNFRLDCIKISRVGLEILNILPPVNYSASVEYALGEKIKGFKTANLHSRVKNNPDGSELWMLTKSLASPVDSGKSE